MMNNIENMIRLCSLVVAISLVCLVSVIQSKDSCGPYSWGKDFYVAFLGPRNPSERYGRVQTDNYEISLGIRSTSFGSLQVLFPLNNQSLTYNITKGDSTVKLPSTLLQNYTFAIQPKGVQLTSNVPVAITATVSCKNYRNVEVLHNVQLLPVSRLSKHYIVGKPGVDINLVALQKSTFNITYAVNDKTRDITGELKPFDSCMLNDSHDGLRSISSSGPIAVFLYSRNTGYAEQISGRTAGHKFIIPSTPYYTAKLRVSAVQDETFIRATVGSETLVMKLDEGKYIESDLKATVTLSSSQPIGVMLNASHYYPSETRITYLPDVSQFAQEYSLDIRYMSDMAYVTIITPTAYEKQLLFSESIIPEWIQTDHVVLDGATYFIATTKLSGKGLHKISMADPSGRFGGLVAVIKNDWLRELYLLGMPLGGY